jgi:Ala-tRNA(Pro) deacylase
MMTRLKEYLDQNRIKYQLIIHSTAYTAQEIAASAHVSGQNFAKVVMVKADNSLVMTVLPATHLLDLRRIKEITAAKHVELVEERDYKSLFEDCEPGAMPPFGNLFNLKVYVSTPLSEEHDIAFNAGSHRELVKISYDDFKKLVKPEVFALSIKEQPGKSDRPTSL